MSSEMQIILGNNVFEYSQALFCEHMYPDENMSDQNTIV